jgi:hypothetical protein
MRWDVLPPDIFVSGFLLKPVRPSHSAVAGRRTRMRRPTAPPRLMHARSVRSAQAYTPPPPDPAVVHANFFAGKKARRFERHRGYLPTGATGGVELLRCARTGLAALSWNYAVSGGWAHPLPHLRRDWRLPSLARSRRRREQRLRWRGGAGSRCAGVRSKSERLAQAGAWFAGDSAATSAPGLGSPLPHLRRGWARPCHICAGTGPTPVHICAGTGLTPSTSAPGLQV